jgi:hypothetical protein
LECGGLTPLWQFGCGMLRPPQLRRYSPNIQSGVGRPWWLIASSSHRVDDPLGVGRIGINLPVGTPG